MTSPYPNQKIFSSGSSKPGAMVFKVGRTIEQTQDRVNGVSVMIWEDESLRQEVAVISQNARSYKGQFADKGDTGSLVVTLEDSLKGVGLVVAKNESSVPWWVAVTPL